VQKPEDGMTAETEAVFHSFWNQERSLCELPSRVTPTQGYRKQGWTRETVKPCCNTPSVRLVTGYSVGTPEEESLERVGGRDSDSDSDSDNEVFLEGWPLGKFKVRQKPRVDCLENSPGRFPI
jgi:hypothetical protein